MQDTPLSTKARVVPIRRRPKLEVTLAATPLAGAISIASGWTFWGKLVQVGPIPTLITIDITVALSKI